MGLLSKLFTNCAHPKGRMGKLMLQFMNTCHAFMNTRKEYVG